MLKPTTQYNEYTINSATEAKTIESQMTFMIGKWYISGVYATTSFISVLYSKCGGRMYPHVQSTGNI